MFKVKEYPVPNSKKAVLFLSPYDTTLNSIEWSIRQINQQGYFVIGYELSEKVFSRGNPQDLKTLVLDVVSHMKKSVEKLKAQGYSSLGIVGTSLGSFIAYNSLPNISEWSWTILISGGDAADSVWSLKSTRLPFEAAGLTKADLTEDWKEIQYPKFGNFSGNKALMISSKADRITRYPGAVRCYKYLEKSHVKGRFISQIGLSHKLTILRNLAKIKTHIKTVERL